MVDGMKTLDDLDVSDKVVLLRVDINCPVERDTKVIVDDTRIRMSAPTIAELARRGAKVVVLAHQGDPLDYRNFTLLKQHRRILESHCGEKVDYIEDAAGPAALDRVRALMPGQVLLLENVRIYTEETIIFEEEVKLPPSLQTKTLLVEKLSPLADFYVCDAFAAAHRSEPSLVGFPRLMPSACGRLFEKEVAALARVRDAPQRPCVFVLGGAKILDAFKMMREALRRGSADTILTTGLAGEIVLLASGRRLGRVTEDFIRERNLESFVAEAQALLRDHADRIRHPVDVAVSRHGARREIPVVDLPVDELIVDVGQATISAYSQVIGAANTVFLNGPAGVYEDEISAEGTRRLWEIISRSNAYSVVGGGDTIAAAGRFGLVDRFSYVSTAGGGLIRFMSGEKLPVIEALKASAQA